MQIRRNTFFIHPSNEKKSKSDAQRKEREGQYTYIYNIYIYIIYGISSEARYTQPSECVETQKVDERDAREEQKYSSCVQLNDEKQRKMPAATARTTTPPATRPRSATKYNETFGSSNDDDCTVATRTLTTPARSAAVAGTAGGTSAGIVNHGTLPVTPPKMEEASDVDNAGKKFTTTANQ